MKYYIGIDNGVNGGISILNNKLEIVEKQVMPVIGKIRKEYDINGIINVIKPYIKKSVTILEKAQPQYRDGSKQAFKTGFGYGVIQGILVSSNASYEIISPKIWQKKIFKGLCSKDTKSASILYCMRKYPNEDWTATKRSKKYHDGMTDATCLAIYGKIEHEK